MMISLERRVAATCVALFLAGASGTSDVEAAQQRNTNVTKVDARATNVRTTSVNNVNVNKNVNVNVNNNNNNNTTTLNSWTSAASLETKSPES